MEIHMIFSLVLILLNADARLSSDEICVLLKDLQDITMDHVSTELLMVFWNEYLDHYVR